MKKYFSFAIVALLAMFAMVSSGCSEDNTENYSVQIQTNSTLGLSKHGGSGRLDYALVGARGVVAATADVDWLSAFDVSEPGQVRFKYTASEEERTGHITLTYPGAAPAVVTVTQGVALSFTIEVLDVTPSVIGVKVIPTDAGQLYFTAAMSVSGYEKICGVQPGGENDEFFVEQDIEMAKADAADRNVTWEEYIQHYGRSGENPIVYSNLTPDYDYYIYAYFITETGEALSELTKIKVHTTHVDIVPCTFDIAYKQINADPYPDNNVYNVEVTITPSNPEAKWMFTPMNKFVYVNRGYENDAEYLYEVQSDLRKNMPTLYEGPQTFMLEQALTNRVWGGAEYYIWCFSADDGYNINSAAIEDIERQSIKTNEIPVTNDCTFKLELVKSFAQDLEFNIVPSDEETKYFVGMYPRATAESAGDNDCVERLLQRIDLGEFGSKDFVTADWSSKGTMLNTRIGRDHQWRVEPETEYTIYVFGFDMYGHRSTEIARLDFKSDASVDLPEDWKIEFEASDIHMRGFTMKMMPSDEDVWYAAGLYPSEGFDEENIEKFLDDLIHADGGGKLPVYVGEETLVANATPGTKYVCYAFAYADGHPRGDFFFSYVTTLPRPLNENATVKAEWTLYDGSALHTMSPGTFGESFIGSLPFFFQVTPTSDVTAHTWGFLHAARSSMNNSDEQIMDYFDIYPMFGQLDAEWGVYTGAGEGTFGFFYCGTDADGQFGPMNYEEVVLKASDVKDPSTAPKNWKNTDKKNAWEKANPGKDWEFSKWIEAQKNGGAAETASIDRTPATVMSAPIRFSTASFMQIDREKSDLKKAASLYNGKRTRIAE